MIYSKIAGTGSFLPEKIVTNGDLESVLETTDEWIFSRTGISQRHISAEHETVAFMGAQASRQAITAAGLQPNDIDMIIVSTCTPDKLFPSTACLIQHQLGITQPIPAFDISAACAGFIYGISIADNFIKSSFVNNILLIGSEKMSRTVSWQDRSTCILFGDGAGAVVLSKSDMPGIHSTHIHADGSYGDLLKLDNPLMLDPELERQYLTMEGKEVFKLAVNAMSDAVEEIMTVNKNAVHKLDWLVPHQANMRIISALAKRLQLPMEQVILTIGQHANTSGASIPLALDEGVRSGKILPGHTVLMEGFGAGLTWGSALVTM